ncbi:hypothetical protein P171DRAFT_491176 [Karstenula rhodostoma CBS 690.94]|uniref:Uncharacterized protein n=1 Tax=Karstenula rhodostoma CBS 690.94 TaxID=1392251 RepID=A0A9P4P6R9_9PLEO|nr:hypothetical protein P171DRAFT_491176 [Karstenula rhodostoma CBS 690.94]
MNVGALTTAFVPAPGCNDTIYGKVYRTGTVTSKWHSLGQTDTKSCYPSGFTTPDAYYSPGICPSAWSSACGNVESIGSMTETRVTCCPVGYICATPRGDPWDTFSCSRFYTQAPKILVPQQDANGRTIYMETTLGALEAYANQIEIRFQKADFETAASTTSSTSQTMTQTDALPTRTSGTVDNTNTAAGSGGGTGAGGGSGAGGGNGSRMTAGSWAGIGVGVAVVLVALVGLLVFLTRLRRKKGSKDAALDGELDGGMAVVHSAAEMANSTPVCEVGHREIGEVRGDMVMPDELDPKARAYQLE